VIRTVKSCGAGALAGFQRGGGGKAFYIQVYTKSLRLSRALPLPSPIAMLFQGSGATGPAGVGGRALPLASPCFPLPCDRPNTTDGTGASVPRPCLLDVDLITCPYRHASLHGSKVFAGAGGAR